MNNKLFYLADKTAYQMREHYYETEADLQKIVAQNPHLLIRDTENSEDKQMFLISREQLLQVKEDNGNSFSADHFMVRLFFLLEHG